MAVLNATHDAQHRSFVERANLPDCDFPIQNLPFGVFSRANEPARGGVAIGDMIVDLAALARSGLLSGAALKAAEAASGPTLNPLMALGNAPSSALRARLSELLAQGSSDRQAVAACLVPMTEVAMHLPAHIGDFTDFLTSGYHSTRLNPTGKLAANFMSLPIAYHGRASSVRLDGPVRRPHVQRRDGEVVSFGPTKEMDFELELGAFIGAGNRLGDRIAIADASDAIFGHCLINDWSIRDIQRWENVPLGPFLAKSLSTTISPWVVTEEALRPFRAPAFRRAADEPAPLPYLTLKQDQDEGGLDLALTASLLTPRMREAGLAPHKVTDTNFRHMYWTFAQMVTHHASNGCNLQPGDLLGSGTISGPTPGSRACLAELTVRGKEPLHLPNGETRPWLEDGDEVIFAARASRQGYVSIGFGNCRGTVQAAL
jgi:fumarylacetoacetase